MPIYLSNHVYSSNEVAKICGVGALTVCKWFDSGELGGYRNGPQNDRCIPGRSLIVFLENYKIPFIVWQGRLHTDEKFYTTGEAANFSGLSRATIIRFGDKRKLKCFRIPKNRTSLGDRRFPHSSFIAFLEENGILFEFNALVFSEIKGEPAISS